MMIDVGAEKDVSLRRPRFEPASVFPGRPELDFRIRLHFWSFAQGMLYCLSRVFSLLATVNTENT